MKLANWIAVLGCVGIGAASAMGAPGCTASITAGPGDGGFPFGDDDGGTHADTGPAPVVDPCNQCLYSGCAGQDSVCFTSSPDCLTIFKCAIACTTGACVQACYDATPNGQAAYSALALCDHAGECGTCATQCASLHTDCSITIDDAGTPDTSTGTDAAPPDTDAGSVSACDTCQHASCASQIAACAPGTVCANYNNCVVGCSDATCVSKCSTDYAAGQTTAGALGACTLTNCSTACKL